MIVRKSKSYDLVNKKNSWPRFRSIYIVHLSGFVFALGYSVVFTGLFAYLHQLMPNIEEDVLIFRYGVVNAMYPLSGMIFAPLFGWIETKQSGKNGKNKIKRKGIVQKIGFFSASSFFVGNTLYALTSYVSANEDVRFVVILISRIIAGIASAFITTARSYIASATYPEELTTQMSINTGFQSLGLTLGPGIQAALIPIGCSPASITESQDRYFNFDLYTTVGIIMASIGILLFISYLPCFFTEFNLQLEPDHPQNKSNSLQDVKDCSIGDTKNIIDPKDKSNNLLPIMMCILSYCLQFSSYVYLETIGTPICLEQFGWSQQDTVLYYGILLGSNGMLSLVYYMTAGPLSKRFDERKLLIFFTISASAIGRILFLPIPGNPSPPVCSNQNSSVRDSNQYFLMAMGYNEYNMDYRYHQDLGMLAYSGSDENIPCEGIGINSNSTSSCCPLEWCEQIPAITVPQFIFGWLIGTLGYAYSTAFTISLISKLLNPQKQGLWMGLFTALSQLFGTLAPLAACWLYTDYGTYWAFSCSMMLSMLAAFLNVIFFKRLEYRSTKS